MVPGGVPGGETVVDLNADLAEGEDLTASDRVVLDSVTSASLACGFHAGSRALMRATAAACVSRGVQIGAHVSYRDRQGFGRRTVEADPGTVTEDVAEQVAVLTDAIAPAGASPAYLKPHGALYHRMAADPATAAAIVEAMVRTGLGVVLAPPGSAVAAPAAAAGCEVIPEAFPDRGYRPDGGLVPRSEPGALIGDPEEVGRRAVSLACRGGVDADDGTWIPLRPATLCVHGDAPGASGTARAVRAALESAGVILRAFARSAPPW